MYVCVCAVYCTSQNFAVLCVSGRAASCRLLLSWRNAVAGFSNSSRPLIRIMQRTASGDKLSKNNDTGNHLSLPALSAPAARDNLLPLLGCTSPILQSPRGGTDSPLWSNQLQRDASSISPRDLNSPDGIGASDDELYDDDDEDDDYSYSSGEDDVSLGLKSGSEKGDSYAGECLSLGGDFSTGLE